MRCEGKGGGGVNVGISRNCVSALDIKPSKIIGACTPLPPNPPFVHFPSLIKVVKFNSHRRQSLTRGHLSLVCEALVPDIDIVLEGERELAVLKRLLVAAAIRQPAEVAPVWE